MQLEKLIEKNKSDIILYEYYKKLGYSEEASILMTLFHYGDLSTTRLFSKASDFKSLKAYIEDSKQESIQALLCSFDFDSQNIVMSPSSRVSARPFTRMLSKQSMKTAAPMVLAAENHETTAVYSYAPMAMPGLLENISTDTYENIEERGSKNALTSPSSTFRMTTNTASMGIFLNQLRNHRHVSMSQIRIEEILNYFNYKNNVGTHDKINIDTAYYEKENGKALVYINTDMGGDIKEHQNLVLLLDTSGSMYTNSTHTQQAIATIFSKLKKNDRISLITYSSEDHVYLKGHKITSDTDKEKLMYKIIKEIIIKGCTNGSAGIETAYKIGKKYYNEEYNNEVILITDGDLNFGVTKKDGLKKLIEEKKQSGLFLSVIGTGLWNFMDDKLESLAKYGNGIYTVVNNLSDVDYSINQRFLSLTQVVAKDVKAQVEFNPKFVKSYRLLGYENRELAHEDFENDDVVSEPYGLGGHGVALYEIELQNGEIESPLKYQKPELTNDEELGELRIRYKEPLDDVSQEVVKPIKMTDKNDEDVRLAYALYVKSEILRESDKIDESDKEFLKNFDIAPYKEMNNDNLEAFLTAEPARPVRLL